MYVGTAKHHAPESPHVLVDPVEDKVDVHWYSAGVHVCLTPEEAGELASSLLDALQQSGPRYRTPDGASEKAAVLTISPAAGRAHLDVFG